MVNDSPDTPTDAASAQDGEPPEWGARVAQAVQDGNSQTMFLRQQVSQLHNAVSQLYDAVSAQCVQLQKSDTALVQELQRLQTGGPQRAMAGVYAKLFRDLIAIMNELDALVRVAEKGMKESGDDSWLTALRIVRDRFENVLRDWGCTPIDVRLGEDEFDPEIHEAVASPQGAPGRSSNKVLGVQRRGWAFGDTLLQYPQVHVD
jgi:molecular chaperone GrpE (heat shock protein)